MPRKDTFNKKELVLSYIKSQVQKNGFPPSVREICQSCDIKSTSTVHLYINKLMEDGLLEKHPSRPRAIKITDKDYNIAQKINEVPILGKVAAGTPILATENLEGTFPLPVELTGEGAEVFILKVKGDSMIEAGILDGDYIIVRHQNTAINGDIIVAMLDEEVTIKRFFKEKSGVRLQPENPHMKPLFVTSGLNILGKAVGVIRKM